MARSPTSSRLSRELAEVGDQERAHAFRIGAAAATGAGHHLAERLGLAVDRVAGFLADEEQGRSGDGEEATARPWWCRSAR
jgi:hypothetical protein